MHNITIIGAGWLGQPLAHTLIAQGHRVRVSCTSTEKCQTLRAKGLTAFVVDLDQTPISTLAQQLIQQQSQIVIGCFPPRFRHGAGNAYIRWWQTLVAACQQAKVEKVVMVSSSSVYPALAEEMREEQASFALAQHSSHFSESATWLLQAEQAVIDANLPYVIVRLSGLMGSDRHPARFVAHMSSVSANAPANMLHQQDAIGAIIFCALQVENQVVNATTPRTVSKAEFYQHALNVADSPLTLPPIDDKPDKQIIADKLQLLGYRFHFTHTLDALDSLVSAVSQHQ